MESERIKILSAINQRLPLEAISDDGAILPDTIHIYLNENPSFNSFELNKLANTLSDEGFDLQAVIYYLTQYIIDQYILTPEDIMTDYLRPELLTSYGIEETGLQFINNNRNELGNFPAVRKADQTKVEQFRQQVKALFAPVTNVNLITILDDFNLPDKTYNKLVKRIQRENETVTRAQALGVLKSTSDNKAIYNKISELLTNQETIAVDQFVNILRDNDIDVEPIQKILESEQPAVDLQFIIDQLESLGVKQNTIDKINSFLTLYYQTNDTEEIPDKTILIKDLIDRHRNQFKPDIAIMIAYTSIDNTKEIFDEYLVPLFKLKIRTKRVDRKFIIDFMNNLEVTYANAAQTLVQNYELVEEEFNEISQKELYEIINAVNQNSYYRAPVTFNDQIVDVALADQIFYEIELDDMLRVIIYKPKIKALMNNTTKLNPKYKPKLEKYGNFTDRYVTDYAKLKPDTITIKLFGKKPTRVVNIDIDLTNSSIGFYYDSKAFLSVEEIQAKLESVGFQMARPTISTTKRLIYFGVPGEFINNFSAIAGYIVMIDPLLSNFISVRDDEKMTGGNNAKKNFAVKSKKLALIYKYKGERVLVNLEYDNVESMENIRYIYQQDFQYAIELSTTRHLVSDVIDNVTFDFRRILPYLIDKIRGGQYNDFNPRFREDLDVWDLPVLRQEEKPRKRATNTQKLWKFDEAIFPRNFTRIACSADKLPEFITATEAEELAEKGFETLEFPKENPKYILACKNPKYKHIGVVINKLPNNETYPYLPCCFESNQTNKPNFKRFMDDLPPTDDKTIATTIKSGKILSPGQEGLLPKDLEFMIRDLLKLQGKEIYRRGTVSLNNENSSIIACLVEAVSQIEDPEDLEDYIVKLNPDNQFMDPKTTVNFLENKFNVNIYILDNDGFVIEDYKGFPIFNPPTDGLKVVGDKEERIYRDMVLIYYNRGSEVDINKVPRCELVVFKDTKTKNYFKMLDPNANIKFSDLINESYKTAVVQHSTGELYFNPFSKYSLKDVFGDSIVAEYIDSYGKTRALRIRIDNGVFIDLEVFPNQPMGLKQLDFIEPLESEVTDTVLFDKLGKPNSTVDFSYNKIAYRAYMYNYLGMQNMIKAFRRLDPQPNEIPSRSWTIVFTVPIVSQHTSLANNYIETYYSSIIFLKIVYWIFSSHSAATTPLSRFNIDECIDFLTVEAGANYYSGLRDLPYKLPQLTSVKSKLKFVSEFVPLVDNKIAVSKKLYTNIRNLLKYLKYNYFGNGPLPSVSIIPEKYILENRDIFVFKDAQEYETYLTENKTEAAKPVLLFDRASLYDAKFPVYFYEHGYLYYLGGEEGKKRKYYNATGTDYIIIKTELVAPKE